VILRAHPSNFRQLGFVQEVEIEELCELGVPVIDDVGSGVLADDLEVLREEPPVRRSVRAGAALVCFSGDKLLGGPQAGLLVGRADAVAAARAHPLARALRLGKLGLAALEATLRLYRDPERARREIPVLAMLTADNATLRARAERLAAAVGGEIVDATAKVGGGALPLLELPGPAVALTGGSPDALAARLRAADPPVVGRIEAGRLLLDPRTLADDEIALVARALS
jgi:L-seryl-tRNA(Ser) seleniumtransferase